MTLSDQYDWKNILSILAFVLSLVSFWFSRRSWLQSNRPIVTAAVETYTTGSVLIAYNLAVSNTGNRPATNVRIRVKKSDVDACITDWVKHNEDAILVYSRVMRCFSDDGEIPLLLNGKTMTNSFGYTRRDHQTFWRYGSRLPITIEYSDLDGRKYLSKQCLKVKDSEGFAGGIWVSSKNES